MSKKINFTDRKVASLPSHDQNSASKSAEYTDEKRPGLKLQVGKSGRKTWYFRYTYRAVKQALRIGEFPAISTDDARNRAVEFVAVLESGRNPKDGVEKARAMPTVAEFSVEYLEFVRKYKRSAEDDAAKLRMYILPAMGKKLLGDVSKREIVTFVGDLAGKLSPATQNRFLALLNRFFNVAVDWDLITRNPCSGIKKHKESIGHQQFLSPDEARRVLAAADCDRNLYAGQAVKFLLLTGVRREEALQARWEHVDLEQGLLFLPKTKSGRTRHVILNDAAKALLGKLPRVQSSPWVFPGRDTDKPLCNPVKAFHRILDAAGVGRIRLHDCRHSFASLLVNGGASLFQVQQLLGHSSPNMTMRYSHLAAGTLRATSQIMADMVSPA